LPKRKPISEKLRAEDEKLRDMLKHADMKKFDAIIGRAFQAPGPRKVSR